LGVLSLNISIFAAGAWGTALAIVFSARHQVTLWTHDSDLAYSLLQERENRQFLPGFQFPNSLEIETDITKALAKADLLIVATPLLWFRETLASFRDCGPLKPLLWVCKGLEAGSAKLPHQVVDEELGDLFAEKAISYGALTGPSFAEEVARGLPTAVTLASTNLDFAQQMASQLYTPYFRVYANDDLPGAEIGGAAKNVIAVATGICDGLKLGLNARAALMTRGLAEITRLGIALGGRYTTFLGLAGMGDLILTCTGDLSRNRKVGLALAAGKKLSQILAELGHVAEGVSAARELARLSEKLQIEMPITRAVDDILHNDLPVLQAMEQLLSRDIKPETA